MEHFLNISVCVPNMKIVSDLKAWFFSSTESNEMGGACSAYGERRGVYSVLVAKPEGKILLGRPRRRWEYNIMIDLQEVGCGGMDWIDVAQTGTGGGPLRMR